MPISRAPARRRRTRSRRRGRSPASPRPSAPRPPMKVATALGAASDSRGTAPSSSPPRPAASDRPRGDRAASRRPAPRRRASSARSRRSAAGRPAGRSGRPAAASARQVALPIGGAGVGGDADDLDRPRRRPESRSSRNRRPMASAGFATPEELARHRLADHGDRAASPAGRARRGRGRRGSECAARRRIPGRPRSSRRRRPRPASPVPAATASPDEHRLPGDLHGQAVRDRHGLDARAGPRSAGARPRMPRASAPRSTCA